MTHVLINLTLSVVMEEIENVLDQYPEHPYQSAFSMPELKQKLIDHVHFYVLPHDEGEENRVTASRNPSTYRPSFLQERLRLGMLIRGSMLHLLRQEMIGQEKIRDYSQYRP